MKKLLIALMAALVLIGCEKEEKPEKEKKYILVKKNAGHVFPDPDLWEISGGYWIQTCSSSNVSHNGVPYHLKTPMVTGDTLKDTTLVVYQVVTWPDPVNSGQTIEYKYKFPIDIQTCSGSSPWGVMDFVIDNEKIILRWLPKNATPTQVEYVQCFGYPDEWIEIEIQYYDERYYYK